MFLPLQESYNGGRERSLESKSPRHQQNSLEVKKPKLEEPFSPQNVMAADPFGLYLYQQWASTVGKTAGPMHPAAASAAFQAFSTYYTQAIKVNVSVVKSDPRIYTYLATLKKGDQFAAYILCLRFKELFLSSTSST